MARETAGIVGPRGAGFSVTVDSGQVNTADLVDSNGTKTALTIGADGRSIVVAKPPGLLAGDSRIELGTLFAPGDNDANIGLAPGADPGVQVRPRIIPNNVIVFDIFLFGD